MFCIIHFYYRCEVSGSRVGLDRHTHGGASIAEFEYQITFTFTVTFTPLPRIHQISTVLIMIAFGKTKTQASFRSKARRPTLSPVPSSQLFEYGKANQLFSNLDRRLSYYRMSTKAHGEPGPSLSLLGHMAFPSFSKPRSSYYYCSRLTLTIQLAPGLLPSARSDSLLGKATVALDLTLAAGLIGSPDFPPRPQQPSHTKENRKKKKCWFKEHGAHFHSPPGA